MSSLRWEPPDELTAHEQMLLKTAQRTTKLFGLLRLHRRALFDDAFQDELGAVCRRRGAGREPHAPAFMAMIVLLQA